ncbi:MAG: outer membrane protein transport protein [Desulfovibrio sp.]|jgi:long-chain fatty acid transport protein|nr:outer membrane protein transport protein [Desulfovibrio sp.]
MKHLLRAAAALCRAFAACPRPAIWMRPAACFALLFCLLPAAAPAHAEGFALYEYSARGVALGGSLMARKPDSSAVAYNPALLTRLPGVRAMAGTSLIMPGGRIDWKENGREGSSGLRDAIWPIPHAYYTHQINDDWFFGIGEFTRYGLGFEYPHDWPGRFNIYEISMSSASLNPNIAWRATDKLSIAAGIEIIYVYLDLKKCSRIDAPGGSFEVDSKITGADGWGVGGNLALHYQFNDQWAAGLQYRSQARVHAFGNVDFTYKGAPYGQAAFDSNFHNGHANAPVVLPDSISGGVSWTPIPELSIEVGAIWTHWATFDNLNIRMPDPLPTSLSDKNWHNTWRLNIGVEYEATDWLTLRAGYVWDESPMSEAYEDYLVPTDDRSIYSLGLGIHWDAWTVDLAYALIDPSDRNYDADNTIHTVKSRTGTSWTNIVSMSVGYKF